MNTDTMSLLTRRTILFHAYNVASMDQKIHPNEDRLLQHLARKMDVGVDWYNDLVKGDASEFNEKNSLDYCMPPESMYDRVLSFAYLLYMCNVDFESAPEERELVKQFAMMYELTPEAFAACLKGEPEGKTPEEIARSSTRGSVAMEKSHSKDPYDGILGDRKSILMDIFQVCQENIDFCQEFIQSPELVLSKRTLTYISPEDGSECRINNTWPFPPIYKNVHPGTIDWMKRVARKYAAGGNRGLSSKLSTLRNSAGFSIGDYMDAGECESIALALGMDASVLRHVEESDSPTDATKTSNATGIPDEICDSALELIAREGFIKRTDLGYSFVEKPKSYMDLPSEDDILALTREKLILCGGIAGLASRKRWGVFNKT